MARSKIIVIVSGLVDATIKEYQPDKEFKIFKNLESLSEYLETTPIRAELLFCTQDVVASNPGSSFTYLKDIVTQNDYMSVDKIVYITEDNARELSTLNYLLDEYQLENWEIVTGTLHRSFIQEVINGTFRADNYKVNRKVVIRKPRADYVKQKLREHPTLAEEYVSDEDDLKDIPDEEIPEVSIVDRPNILNKVYISGMKTHERVAFSILAAQYLSRTDKVLLIESDAEYHLVTEYVTKSAIDCLQVPITDLYNNVEETLTNIRNSVENLVVITCIDRIPFDYRYISTLLYYNLLEDFDYMIFECDIEELPHAVEVTVVVPSTVTDVLEVGQYIDKSQVPYIRFIGVDLKYLPEVHINSGTVLGSILNDILTESDIKCPVITISSLRLGNAAYDLGAVLWRKRL